MDSMYHGGQRELQDHFDCRRLADKLQEKMVKSVISQKQKAFIEASDMFFLSTADEKGQPTCSYRGGDPGFVRALDDHTLILPNYDGDGMYLSWGNVLKNPRIGMLFIDFMKGWRLRIHGTAELRHADPLLDQYPGAQFLIRITLSEVFANCPRYIHKYQLVERSSYVPRANATPPVPDWKKSADIVEVLPANDPARNSSV